MLLRMKKFWSDEQGASAVEYALIAGLVAVILIAALGSTGTFGAALQNMFSRLAGKMDEVATP